MGYESAKRKKCKCAGKGFKKFGASSTNEQSLE